MGRYKSAALFVILGGVWGGAYPAIKAGLAHMPPVIFAALRYDLASLIMLGYVVYRSDYWHPRTRADWLNAGIGGVFLIGAYNGLLFVGELSIPSAVAGILVGTVPLFSAVFSRLVVREDIDAYGVVGVFLGFVGIFVVLRPDVATLLESDLVGKLLVLAAAVSVAFGSVLTETVDARQPVETMETWSMIFGAVLLHVVAYARPGNGIGQVAWTQEAVLMLAYLAVVSSAFAYFLYFTLLDRLGAFELNFIAYVAAAFGALFGWLLLDERLSALTMLGFLIVLVGFLLLKWDEVRRELLLPRAGRERTEPEN